MRYNIALFTIAIYEIENFDLYHLVTFLGVFVSKSEAKHAYIAEFQAKEKKYKETIAKLQEGNRQLLLEVVNLKDDLLGSDRDA